MNDQAESLRRLVERKNDGGAKVIAVVSGKGGVGKSNISLNFALSLAKLNKKVAVLDLDIGMANIDILMGLTPSYHMMSIIEDELTIWDVIEDGPNGIAYIAGGSSFSTFVEVDEKGMNRFFQQLEQLCYHYDYIVMDMGAGVTKTSLQFTLASHDVFIVTTPEPTALTDAYAMMKHILQHDQSKPFYLIVNRADSKKEGTTVLNSFTRVAAKFLNKDVHGLGMIPFDKKVMQAVKSQTPFVLMDEHAKAAKAMQQIASTYIGEQLNKASRIDHFVTKMKRLFNK